MSTPYDRYKMTGTFVNRLLIYVILISPPNGVLVSVSIGTSKLNQIYPQFGLWPGGFIITGHE